MRGRDFESLVRKSNNIHSDIRQMLLLYSKIFFYLFNNKFLLNFLVRISKNMQLYFAEKLHEAMFSTRLDHESIIRILVTRSEVLFLILHLHLGFRLQINFV